MPDEKADDEESLPTLEVGDEGQAATTQASATPGPERRIGPYRVVRKIGSGGMGMVYLAVRDDAEFHKRVAIKVIGGGADSAEVVRHFRRERQILAGLDHPNIARLLDGGTTDEGLPYFVMEYIEGQPLLAYCDSRALTIAERLAVFLPLCSAVQYAHRNLVVHRDIKPGNVLVGADGVPKLLDFGIAKLLNPDLAGESPTLTSAAMTPEYASPEQARLERITTASDVYSLGVVLYVLLTGRLPYRLASRNPIEVLKAIAEQEPERPSTAVTRPEGAPVPDADKRRRRLEGDLDNILMLALAKEPHRRYPSVEAFSDDIGRYLRGLPVRARKPTPAYRAAKFVRRHAVAVAAAGLAAVLLAAFGVATAVQSARIARERDIAERERALAQRERATAQRVSAFLVDLFRVSDPGEARGNSVTAREVLDKGAARVAEELKDEPEIRATLMDTIGNVYRNLGLLKQATPLVEGALATRRTTLGPDHADVGLSLNNLAVIKDDLGEYAAADTLFREALAVRRKALGDDHPDVASTLNNLANVLYNKGDYAGAAAMHAEALAGHRRHLGDGHADVAMSHNNLANALYGTGDLAGAIEHNRAAVDIWRRLHGNEHPMVARGLNNLAVMTAEKGDLAAAEALAREAVALGRKTYGESHSQTALFLETLMDTLCQAGKPSEAVPLGRRSAAIFKKELRPDHPFVAVTESVLGGCLTQLGRYAEAGPLLASSHRALAAALGADNAETKKAAERLAAHDGARASR
jgi:serine/threonine-protein kinase